MTNLKVGGKLPAWGLAAMWAAMGFAVNEPVWIAFAMTFAGVMSVIADLRRPRGFGPATIWALSMAVTGLADGIGMLVADPTTRARFFLYAVDEHLARAEAITFLGSSAILLGFAIANRKGPHRDCLPAISAGPRSEAAWAFVFVAGVVVFVMQVNFVAFGRDTFSSLYSSGVTLAVFVLAREATSRGSSKWLWAAALLAYAGATRAVFFEILRALILLPIAALVLGCLVGARSLKPFRQVPLMPMYAGLAIFVVFFQTFGEERGTAGYGLERVQEMIVRREQSGRGDTKSAGLVGTLARQTSFNQVTQIVRIAQTEGFEYGSTFDYFAFVFIPRFLWEDKPLIAKGRWFAERLGFGAWRTEGGFTNSINMTIPGEWYLNFGWPGPVVGGVLVGLCVGLFWNAARFWMFPSGPVAGAYAFSMLAFTWQLNVDTQVIPSLIAFYLVFLAASGVFHAVTLLAGPKRGTPPQRRDVIFSQAPKHT